MLIISLAGCSNKVDALYEEYATQIEDEILHANLETAYTLCLEALSLDLNDEQRKDINSLRLTILEIAFPGTWVVQPEYIISVEPKRAGGFGSYFTVGMLNKYDNVFCQYGFDKESERDLAAEQYNDYLDEKYNYLDLKVTDGYICYYYADEKGNSLKLQILTEEHDGYVFVIHLDSDLYEKERMDLSNSRASLLDTSILLNY